MMRLQLFLSSAFMASLLCLSPAAHSQPTGLLYDPEPPADSGYVRVIHTGRSDAMDVSVDGGIRVRSLPSNKFSDYLVLKAGKHALSIHPAGKPAARLPTTIDVAAGRALTLALTALGSDKAPIVLEDKLSSNKLKAQLAIYHLDGNAGALNILTADGKTQVFSNANFGTTASVQVNPISVDLIAARAGEKTPQARTSFSMTQGDSYSLLIFSSNEKKLTLKITQNKTERYIGK